MSLKPRTLSHVEAASLPYVSATVWSALVVTAELACDASRRDRRVLVCGAAGGIGTLAVQLLKAWGCEVGEPAAVMGTAESPVSSRQPILGPLSRPR